jgi:catechol 2,3-dioxygenase-like lactoylglutathione lyase family enzyme
MLATARLQTIVCVSDLDRARHFYGELLGLPVSRTPFNGLVFDAGGSDLMVAPTPDPTPSAHTVIGFAVADVRAVVRALADKGLACHRAPHLSFDPDGIATAPDGTRVAWYRDPDGNFLSVVQLPPGGTA